MGYSIYLVETPRLEVQKILQDLWDETKTIPSAENIYHLVKDKGSPLSEADLYFCPVDLPDGENKVIAFLTPEYLYSLPREKEEVFDSTQYSNLWILKSDCRSFMCAVAELHLI